MPDMSFAPYLPFVIATDPGGYITHGGTATYPVEQIVPVQHSPAWSWSVGTPYPGPAAQVTPYIDTDAARYWGRMGQGATVWTTPANLITPNLPPNLPQDLYQHIGAFNSFQGGYPSIARNRPTSFGDQVPQLDIRSWFNA